MLAILQLTRRCNYSCPFCFVDVTRPSGPVTATGHRAVLEELAAGGVSQVTLSGGEPTIVADVDDVVAEARSRGMAVTLLTNGGRPRAGVLTTVDAIQVSIDGPPPTHDRVRGRRGAFARAVRTIRVAQEHGTPVSVQITVTDQTVAHLAETLREVGRLATARVSVVAVDDGSPPHAAGEWLGRVKQAVLDYAYSRPSTADIACNVAGSAAAAQLVRERLHAGPLPWFVDLEDRSVSLGLPELRIGELDPSTPAVAARVQARAAATADRLAAVTVGTRRVVNVEAVLGDVVRRAIGSPPSGPGTPHRRGGE